METNKAMIQVFGYFTDNDVILAGYSIEGQSFDINGVSIDNRYSMNNTVDPTISLRDFISGDTNGNKDLVITNFNSNLKARIYNVDLLRKASQNRNSIYKTYNQHDTRFSPPYEQIKKYLTNFLLQKIMFEFFLKDDDSIELYSFQYGTNEKTPYTKQKITDQTLIEDIISKINTFKTSTSNVAKSFRKKS